MEKIAEIINEFIKNLREDNPEDFNPITLSQSRERYSTSKITPVVIAVSLLPEHVVRPRIEKAFVQQKANTLRFCVKALLANGWDIPRIIEDLQENDKIAITEAEFQTILDAPEDIIRLKTNYQDTHLQELYLEGIVHIYEMTNGTEEAYILNPRAYVLALMLINDSINEISNPVSKIANDHTHLRQFFLNKNYNRTLLDDQFSSYGLFKLTNGLDFSELAPPRLFDSVNNVTVLLCGIEDYTFQYLRKLKRDYPFDLSFKPSSSYFMEGNFLLMRIQEHLETGLYFNGVNLDGALITKLYDDRYQTLWVNVYDNSITFEEFQEDFQLYNDHIVTQVLHCEYFKEGNDYFIKHLDHEFIFYDLTEYEKRQTDAWQKGNARKRIKTFKIDNGRIPITTEFNALSDFLEMKFKHQDLIKEYFNRVRAKQ